MSLTKPSIHLTTADRNLIVTSILVLTIGSLLLWHFYGSSVLLVLVIGIASIAVAIQIEIYRRIAGQLVQIKQLTEGKLAAQSQDYRQIESLVQVVNLLPLNAPLPPMRVWAISPDFAALIIGLVREIRPAMVLELGSGVSTLVAAYSLKVMGNGKVISLDHDENFARMTEDNLRIHGLTNASVICSPLRDVAIGDQTHQWYDTSPLEGLELIGMLIVDGPPAHTKENATARYPALPILWELLRDDAVIIMDDAIRLGEQQVVESWLHEFPELQVEVRDTEAGAVILRRHKAKARAASG